MAVDLIVVSALTVREVEKPLKDVFHDAARSVLKFSGMFLAVREDVGKRRENLRQPDGRNLAREGLSERVALPRRNPRARLVVANHAAARAPLLLARLSGKQGAANSIHAGVIRVKAGAHAMKTQRVEPRM